MRFFLLYYVDTTILLMSFINGDSYHQYVIENLELQGGKEKSQNL